MIGYNLINSQQGERVARELNRRNGLAYGNITVPPPESEQAITNGSIIAVKIESKTSLNAFIKTSP
ncbi:MAG: hypothetical protein K2N67_01395 [Mucispirillum sp.]|nr:hypothetical protein [Mucispirillum sp.]